MEDIRGTKHSVQCTARTLSRYKWHQICITIQVGQYKKFEVAEKDRQTSWEEWNDALPSSLLVTNVNTKLEPACHLRICANLNQWTKEWSTYSKPRSTAITAGIDKQAIKKRVQEEKAGVLMQLKVSIISEKKKIMTSKVIKRREKVSRLIQRIEKDIDE